MAEYIDKQIILDKCQRLIDVERKQGSDVMNYGRERVNQTEVIMEYIEYMTPTADVIERSEYEKIKIERDISVQQIHDLGNSVSKAIEELQARADMFNKIGDNNNACTTRSALEILKRNIGE